MLINKFVKIITQYQIPAFSSGHFLMILRFILLHENVAGTCIFEEGAVSR